MNRLLVSCFLLLCCTTAMAARDVVCDGFGGYRECRVGTIGRISLVMEFSANACIEGSTWGTRSAGIVWVDRGCRAVFRIEELTGSPQGGGRVVCESEKGNHRVCPADTRFGVSLVRQLSASACVEEVTWGFDREKKQIWVDDGCRAEFVLARGEWNRPAPKLDGVVICESVNGRRVVCKADTGGGAQIIRVLSENACRFGREWGYDNKGIWVTQGCRAEFAVRAPKPTLQTIICNPGDGTRITCPADTEFGIALTRELGDEDCVLDRTWGFDRNGVWVADGCGAQFALGGFRLSASAVPASAKRVVCESVDGKRNECVVEGVRGVGLVRQISDDMCILNRTWGYGPAGIWVAGGCRAEFAVLR